MIEIKNLSLSLGGFFLEDINLEVKDGEYFILLGPTGAGKTVLLEAIAGLCPIKSGQIKVNNRDVTLLGPEKRNIGFAYQDHMLFPHLTVAMNICFGLRHRDESKREMEATASRLAELLGISHLSNSLCRNTLQRADRHYFKRLTHYFLFFPIRKTAPLSADSARWL